jgi:shikimate kinase
MSRIYLIGYRGTGKTTVGPVLAARLGWSFVDADVLLEERAGRSIREIFASEGEAGFRDREEANLRELATRDRHVIATGGGIILRPSNRELLKATGFVAWLTASPEAIWSRMQGDPTTAARRPSLAQGGLAEVRELLTQREPHYREAANVAVPTEGVSPEAAADAILAAWGTTSFSSSKSSG